MLPIRQVRSRAWLLICVPIVWTVAVVVQLVFGDTIPSWAGSSLWLAFMIPNAIRTVRSDRPRLTIDGDDLRIEHGGLFGVPVVIKQTDVHSIVPLWLRPGGHLLVKHPAVVTSRTVCVVGDAGGPHAPVLALVLRRERQLLEVRNQYIGLGLPRHGAKVRGILLAVDDLDAAQRAVQPLGLLARLTPGAFEWLYPKSRSTSPGPDPVYGT